MDSFTASLSYKSPLLPEVALIGIIIDLDNIKPLDHVECSNNHPAGSLNKVYSKSQLGLHYD